VPTKTGAQLVCANLLRERVATVFGIPMGPGWQRWFSAHLTGAGNHRPGKPCHLDRDYEWRPPGCRILGNTSIYQEGVPRQRTGGTGLWGWRKPTVFPDCRPERTKRLNQPLPVHMPPQAQYWLTSKSD